MAWVDKEAAILQSQHPKEWNEAWWALSDPRMLSKSGHRPPGSSRPITKWAVYSIITPPNHNPLSPRPETPEIFTPSTLKVTGDRDHYRKGRFTQCSDTVIKDHKTSITTISAAASKLPSNQTYLKALQTLPQPERRRFRQHHVHSRERLEKLAVMGLQESAKKFPTTTSQEYGWFWGGKTTSEVFGNTSANFTKMAWKKVTSSQE
ncbi:hypothetical protein BC829DRAFT_416882 [Chytridium lagenaria]|nr:hypothetical protein BC829DRAFT_416882 [Chytridium lagenaria]